MHFSNTRRNCRTVVTPPITIARESSYTSGIATTIDPLLTPADAAAFLRVHPKTAIRFAREQVLPAIRLGKHWRFRREDLTAWSTAQVESQSQPKRAPETI
jgi:excisionase family DNA binding protein